MKGPMRLLPFRSFKLSIGSNLVRLLVLLVPDPTVSLLLLLLLQSLEHVGDLRFSLHEVFQG